MPFPRRYKTPQEKNEANRLKSKRSYNKEVLHILVDKMCRLIRLCRNREAILRSRKLKRMALKQRNVV